VALPRIGITAGDPAGIGPEIAGKAADDPRVRSACEPVIYGAPGTAVFEPGRQTAESGRASFEVIRRAVVDARSGRIAGIATAPISKKALSLAGLEWRGHTEMLAALTGTAEVAMMFYSDRLRVVLATIHIPLADVSTTLTAPLLASVIRLTARSLPRFGFPRPKIAVAGLNPHAGEEGVIGFEEIETMTPVINECRAEGIDISGPIPGDTVFVRAAKGEFDVVVATYHDQGLIPVKLLAFGEAVNVTLGLPIIRTSVDHGTAFDIAGRGIANPESMVQAVLLAARLARAS
jgi:4-hydroxythreonine-4-phosphate dehydrogenase